jgi:polyisoprenoid-binding protein YceI
MKHQQAKSLTVGATLLLGVALFLSAAPTQPLQQATQTSASEIVLSFDPAQSKVLWTLDTTLHLVHGTFVLNRGSLHFDPQTGKAGGEIVVDARTGESGNGSRDARMHKEILQTAKYPDVVFHPTQVEGKVTPSGASDVQLHGIFVIHGSEHELIAPVHAELAGDHWKGTAKFELPYKQWGIKDPSNFFLKAKPVVNVELEISGSLKSAQ